MAINRDYDIAFVGLVPGIHEYNYEITDKFFETFQQQDFTDCHANVKLFLDKKSSFMLLKFEIGGYLMVNCDRCNNDLKLELWDEFNITVKMVDEPDLMNEEEGDPDVFYISRGESHINIENLIYEFINLSIPMHKVCGYNDPNGQQCNEDALKMLLKLEEKQMIKPDVNPIWKELEKFKNKKDS
ncbi:MAG TPA: DUF177 domain-containing protein [Niabella sp.]|nr:DUF177 domain-containing protein [Niabella sp.]HQW14983.1 DUF177 domain-containing protein [Niabella sp.]HQX20125.1 DUF177 domain-containing protein [Niabella sp.]HQX40363.1 DUF177 domain-containing protein [Niabella sp.]HRB06730.1 DUF177 domain-containing protein [Niabella sp.]